MRHAPYSTFFDATPVRGGNTRPMPNWHASALATLVHLLGLPRRVAAIRRDVALLGAMSPHELADIGLSRQDVFDAAALPLGHPPGALLTRRAAECRRAGRTTGR